MLWNIPYWGCKIALLPWFSIVLELAKMVLTLTLLPYDGSLSWTTDIAKSDNKLVNYY